MDGGNDDIDGTFGGKFGPLPYPFNVAPQVAPTGNPPVEGADPPVMTAEPAGNVPLEGVVPQEMAAAPAGNVPLQGVVPSALMMAAPAGNVPVELVVPAAMAAAPAGDVPMVEAVPISVVPPTVTPSTGGAGAADTSGRKKRGRPKKYDDQGNLIAPSGAAAGGPSRSGKKGRGRAAGSGNPTPSQSVEEASLPLSMVGWGFTPHLITVETGEDVAVKIATFAVHNDSKGICVLSGSGTVSNVSIRQIGVSGGSQRFEGLFRIMALSGSFSAADSGIRRGRAGGLSVALSGADGRIIGGSIAGTLVAASPITVAFGTYACSDWQNIKGKSPLQEPASASPSAPGPIQAGAAPAPPVNPGANIFLQKTGGMAKADDSCQ